MKNIYFFTFLVIIFISFLLINPAICDAQSNYGFSVAPQFGFVHGQALEFVYPSSNNLKSEILSELRYDMKPVFYLGLQVDFGLTNLMKSPGFFSSIIFKAGFSGDSGFHENRDWRSTENDALTDYSVHTNKTREFFWLDAALGVSIPIESLFYIKPFFSGSWMRFAYTGRDGYGLYARGKKYDEFGNPIPDSSMFPTMFFPIDDNPVYYSYEGRDVIRYQQEWLLLAIGFSVGTDFFSPFSLDLSFQISPFTYCAAMDEHLTTNVTYLDYTSFGFFFEPKGNISIAINKIDLSLAFTYRYIAKTRGQSYFRTGSTGSFWPNGEAGAGLSVMDLRFLVKYRF